MNTRLLRLIMSFAAVITSLTATPQELGTITFETSGAPAAQSRFLRGVKALHSFQFDEAAVAFREAKTLDPDFALAYWGEAMSHNHPLWAQQDRDAAQAVLESLAPTLAGRLAKAALPKERALLEAIDKLYYGAEDKLARDRAYSEHLAELYERWPDDHEIATWYALSLLGTVRPGDTGFRRQALAASIANRVFAENPRHPGAAHFIIHSFDDPEHAPLGLPAARAYAGIAPAAAHALHMPSHIFVQLGLWSDVVASNIAAYDAAIAVNKRLNLPEGREDFHTLSWLAYANLLLGKYDDARANVELARAAAERNPDNAGIRDGYLAMRARVLLETQQWDPVPSSRAPAAGHDEHAAAMPGMSMPQGGLTWSFISGYSAAKRGDLAAADAAVREIAALRERTADAYRAKIVAIHEHEVAAVAAWARGDREAALDRAKAAADLELTLAPPSGPPDPIKPALELYGELLADAGRPADAVGAFEQALARTPKRTPSLAGLGAAAAAAGNAPLARRAYSELAATPGAAADSPAFAAARAWLSAR
jgi:hypothetical protein